MSISLKSASLGAAILAAMVTLANAPADADAPMQQVAQTAGAAAAAVTLPEVVVHPRPQQGWYYNPYTSGRGQHASSNSTIRVPRAPKPTPASWMYDPYADGASPCPSGTSPGSALKCDQIIPMSHPMR